MFLSGIRIIKKPSNELGFFYYFVFVFTSRCDTDISLLPFPRAQTNTQERSSHQQHFVRFNEIAAP